MDPQEILIEKISENCINKMKEERLQADENQLKQINNLLEHWSDEVIKKTKEMVNSVKPSNTMDTLQNEQLSNNISDIKDRHSNLVLAIQEAHNKQIEVLRAAISEERKQFAQAQMIFEQTLKTRYECMVDALHEKVKSEQEARMQRALDNLERSARVESDRAKQSFEIQQEAELTLSNKFKTIVNDLRKSWEEEETGRAMQLEERLRSHYSVVLEHMEAQLKMALRLQDDADKQWLQDVETRNQQQIQTLKAFEDKCRRLYDVRLTEYAEKTNQQIAQYEEQLLEAGTVLASEKAQFESRLRRIKLACSRWKTSYQKEVHERYQDMTNVLEERYMTEVAERLQEINDVKSSLAEVQNALHKKEQDIIKIHKMYAPHGSGIDGNALTTATIRNELNTRWNELKIPTNERIESLVAILDASQVNPAMVTKYEALIEKLTARQPIAQLTSRKQFIEYKLKLASRLTTTTTEGGSISTSERASLISELTEIQSNIDLLMHQYERRFGEHYNKMNPNTTTSTATSSDRVVVHPPVDSNNHFDSITSSPVKKPTYSSNTIPSSNSNTSNTPQSTATPHLQQQQQHPPQTKGNTINTVSSTISNKNTTIMHQPNKQSPTAASHVAHRFQVTR